MRYLDITILCPFVATGEKNHDALSAVDKIDSISWPMVDSQFEHAFSHRLDVAGIAQR